jgi:hypothetical protein
MLSMGMGSPDPPVGTSVVSMFQTNSAALRCIAYFGASKIRPGGVAAVSNIVN